MLWQQGDDMAFEMLYKRYVIELMTLIAGKTGSEETARELTQDVFLAVYQQKMDLHLIGHFNAWLFTIAKNRIIDVIKLRAKEALLIETTPDQVFNCEAEDRIREKEFASLLHEAISQILLVDSFMSWTFLWSSGQRWVEPRRWVATW